MPAATSSHEVSIYRVDDLNLDVARGCVSRGDVEITLSPLSFELLLALVRAAPEVLSHDDLINQVWPGIVVSPETVSQRVKLVRDALGDQATSPRYIAGIRGRGYRIVARVSLVTVAEPAIIPVDSTQHLPVRRVANRYGLVITGVLFCAVLSAVVLWWRPDTTGNHMPAPAPIRIAVSPQSVAVLPFENLSPDRNNAYFATGMQDMVLTKLADIGGLKVISRTSTAEFKSHPDDLRTIGQELGVATILEGSVQKMGNQVLIDVQLTDTHNGHQLWAQSYQRTLQSIFGVEGEVAEKVAVALKARLDPAEQERVASIPTHNPAAYVAYLRGLSLWTNTSAFGPGPMQDIADAYRKAVKLDPNFALAWARLSSILSLSYFNFVDYTPAHLAEAKQALDLARTLAPDLALTRVAEGDYDYYGHHDFANALVAYRKALLTSPNNASALVQIGYVERRQGHWQSAIKYQERALALDPRNVQRLRALGVSYWTLYRFNKAKEIFLEALAIHPGDAGVASGLAGLYQGEGKLAKSEKVLAAVKIPPNDWSFFRVVFRQDLLNRRYATVIRDLQKALVTQPVQPGSLGYYYQQLGFVEQLTGNREASRHDYRKAVAILRQASDWPPMLGVLALAQAGLGEKNTALATARRAMMLLPSSRDAYGSPICKYFLALVQVRVGEQNQAIATLQQLLAAPLGSHVWGMFLSPELLRNDPAWDPLRQDPEFQALLAQYPNSQAIAG